MEINSKNTFREVVFQGKNCIEFTSGGKYPHEVLVDAKTWYGYLHKHHWTATKRGDYVKTSIKNRSVNLHRLIIEKEYLELDYWGNDIDHKNNDRFDNRLENLEICNSKINATNIKSKNKSDNNHLIFPQRGGGYKIHTNVFDEPIIYYRKTLDEARKCRDEIVIPIIDEKIEKMKKKKRDIEFERGLRDKINSCEREEIYEILKRHGIL